jgi:hypothetical protein
MVAATRKPLTGIGVDFARRARSAWACRISEPSQMEAEYRECVTAVWPTLARPDWRELRRARVSSCPVLYSPVGGLAVENLRSGVRSM